MDASKDWNRNSTKAERSANAPPRAWAIVLNVYRMLFSIDEAFSARHAQLVVFVKPLNHLLESKFQ